MSLVVENIKKSFGSNLIFENISFSVNAGEVVSLQGKSGQGKTTILRCINRLETCDRGSIKIGERYLCKDNGYESVYASKEEMTEIRRDMGLVFQNFNLFPHMKVYENIIQGPLFHKTMDKEGMEKRAKKLIERLDLKGKEQLYPYQLSGGQQQRVAIARACMLRPKLLSLDEPTSALDEATIGQIESVIASLRDKDMAILIITHDSSFARKVSDRILFLEDGKIREEKLR